MKKISHKQLAAEIAGWYGAVAILTGYILVSFAVIEGSGMIFQLLNLTGALGLMIIAIYKNVTQSVVLNLIWIVIAAIAITSIVVQ